MKGPENPDPVTGPEQDETPVIEHTPLDPADHGTYADEVNRGIEVGADLSTIERTTEPDFSSKPPDGKVTLTAEEMQAAAASTDPPGTKFFAPDPLLADHLAREEAAIRAREPISVEDLAAIEARMAEQATRGESPIASMRREMAAARAAAQPNLLLVGDRTIFKPALGDTVLILDTELRWNKREGRSNYLPAIVTATSDDGFGVQPFGVPYCQRAFRFDAFAEFETTADEKGGTWRWPPSR